MHKLGYDYWIYYTNIIKIPGNLARAPRCLAEPDCLTRESIRRWVLGAHKFILAENLMDFLVSLKLSETSNPIFTLRAIS